MKAIVVEDELFPRLSLVQKLTEYHPDIEIIAQCEDVESAMKAILVHHPDIVFLDIQLKEKTSLSLLEQLNGATELPHIIFTTAYDIPEYLIKAIKFAAVDYLLKPIDIVELSAAIKKVKDKIKIQSEQIKYMPSTPETAKTFTFHTYNSTLVLKASDILYVTADGNYCNMFLVTGNEEIIFERLGEIEHKLKGTTIIRTGKSHLVNKSYIYKLEHKKRICIFQTQQGTQYKLGLSASGISDLNE